MGLADRYADRGEDEEALCAVCAGGASAEPNRIVYCDRCDLAVHQTCYGVEEIPEGARVGPAAGTAVSSLWAALSPAQHRVSLPDSLGAEAGLAHS